jgi:hypothetical protein
MAGRYPACRSSLAREIAAGGLAKEKERKMTRTSSLLSLVLAMLAALVAAVPAGASEGYRSVDSILASGGTQAPTQGGDPGSVKPLFAGTSGDRSPSGTGGGEYRSADAVLAVSGSSRPSFVSGGEYRSADAVLAASGPQTSQASAGGQRYIDALLRSPETSSPPPVQVVEARGNEGFHWGDALIGALVASLTLLVMLAAARSVARHRRATAESRT